MPKNKGKGGKNRRRGTKAGEGDQRRELIFREDGQEYGQVTRMLGNGRLTVLCFDGRSRLAVIRGKMRKKVWVNQGDIILISLRDFQDDKADVLVKYTSDEARSLKSLGELPENARINETDTYGQDSDDAAGFEFGVDDSESVKSGESEKSKKEESEKSEKEESGEPEEFRKEKPEEFKKEKPEESEESDASADSEKKELDIDDI